jgi:hypothetical protein
MKNKAFRPPKKTSSLALASTHPKTIINRKYDTAKRGLDLALKRADGAFRMSKSRKLRELHLSKHWSQLSEASHAKAEKDIITTLEAQRNEKKRLCEMEWTRGIEAGEYSEEASESEGNDMMEEIEYEKSGEVQDIECEGSEWTTCSEGEDDTGNPTPIHAPTFRQEFDEIKKAFAEGWKIKMEKLEANGKKKGAEFRDYIHSRKV